MISDGRLYGLLPRFYRQRDAEIGEPLRALMDVMEREFVRLEADVEALHDNGFIETCDDWVIPYFAELLGIRTSGRAGSSQRRMVANSTAYRRAQGTPGALENAIHDLSGWPCRVVDDSQLLAASQHVANVQPLRGRTVDVRDGDLSAAFDERSRLAEVARPRGRRYGLGGGDCGVATVRLFLWRLQALPISRAHACPALRTNALQPPLPPGCYRFDTLGRDVHLFRRPVAPESCTERAAADSLPLPLTRSDWRLPHDSARDDRVHERSSPGNGIFGPGRSINIQIRDVAKDTWRHVHPADVIPADLSCWSPSVRNELRSRSEAEVAVDVECGRFMLLRTDDAMPPGSVLVDYAYGSPGDLGGGAYGRRNWSTAAAVGATELLVGAGAEFATLQAALEQWHEVIAKGSPEGPQLVAIRIVDSGHYELPQDGGFEVRLPAGVDLTIAASDGTRPSLRARDGLQINTSASNSAGSGIRRLTLDGLLLHGGVRLQSARGDQPCDAQIDLVLQHCTVLAPDSASARGGVAAALDVAGVGRVRLTITSCVVGAMSLAGGVSVEVSDSLLAPEGECAIGIKEPPTPSRTREGDWQEVLIARMRRTTVLGRAELHELCGESLLLSEPVTILPCDAKHRLESLVSFSYVAPGSSRLLGEDGCQPSAAVKREAAERKIAVSALAPARRMAIEQRLRPLIDGFGRLERETAPEVLSAGRDGGEPGAFHRLHNAERERSLAAALDEYLPLGVEASLRFET